MKRILTVLIAGAMGVVLQTVAMAQAAFGGERLVEYVDESGALRTNDAFSVVTTATAQLTNGWYLVVGAVQRGEIDVATGCTARLVLADGASLTVLGGFRKAGIDVGSGEELVVYGQREGTGRLTVNGGAYAAGIGGSSEAVGRIRICGGTVTAEGGQYGAGIGCGYAGLGGEVVIGGGRVNAIAGRSASRIGRGLPEESACSVSISGGVFAHELEVDWLADGYGVFANPDPTTCATYPYAVLPLCEVMLGDHPHMTAAWTSGDGSETNAVAGTAFNVERGAENVKVIFTAQADWEIVGRNVVDIGTVTADVIFGAESGYRVPTVQRMLVEQYYDASDCSVQSIPIGMVRTVDYVPTAEDIAVADAAIDAAGGSGPKLVPPLVVQNADGVFTIIRGGIEANRLIRRLGGLSPETDIPMRVVGKNRETMLMNSAYGPNVPERTWKSDDFDAMSVVTNFQHYVRDEKNWQHNMTNQMDRLYQLAEVATNGFTQAFMSVTNHLGRSDGCCRETLKGRDRAYAEMVANLPDTGGWPNVNSLYDVFGCTFVLGDEDDFAKAIAVIETEFVKYGFRVVRIKNGYYLGSVTTSGYADVKVDVRYENGFTCEIVLIEANMNREKTEGVVREVDEIRRDYDASTSAAKDGDLQMIMDKLDRLMRLVLFNPREGETHDQFQETYAYLVQNIPKLRDAKYAEIWRANTRAHLEDYIARISDPVMYDGYRARCAELAARTDEVRVGMALGSEAKGEAEVRSLPGRHATISFNVEGLPVIGVDDGEGGCFSVWGKKRLTDAWWVTPHEPARHHFFRTTDPEL